MDRFSFPEILDGLRKGGAYRLCKPGGNLIGKARCNIRLMDNDRDTIDPSSQNNRYGNKSTFGKDNLRLQLSNSVHGLSDACQNTEWIGKIFNIRISSQFAGLHAVIGYIGDFRYQLVFNPALCSDIVNVPSSFFQFRQKGNIGCHMACSAAAG